MRREKESYERNEFERLVKPAKIKVLPNLVFRKAKPAIVGIEIIAGKIKPRIHLITEEGKEIGEILQIQDKGEAIHLAERGMQVAVSIDKPIVGRHFEEGDILYVNLSESHAKKLVNKFQNRLDSDEILSLNEIIEIKRKMTPFWGA
jgi:translation initiation factor 5B